MFFVSDLDRDDRTGARSAALSPFVSLSPLLNLHFADTFAFTNPPYDSVTTSTTCTIMASDLTQDQSSQPHPYLHEPILYISNLAAHVSDQDLAILFEHCVPFRPRIARENVGPPLSGTIEFKALEKGQPSLRDIDPTPLFSDPLFVFSRESSCNATRACCTKRISTYFCHFVTVPAWSSQPTPSARSFS